MRRRLFNLIAATSLILCVAFVTLWARSLRHFELVQGRYSRWPRADESYFACLTISWYSNTLRFELIHITYPPAHFHGRSIEQINQFRAAEPPGLRWHWVGDDITAMMNGYPVGYEARHYPYTTGPTSPGDRWVLATRPWVPTLATAILPAMWVRRFCRKRHLRGKGHCLQCGYDLRATPKRCPECGFRAS